MSTQSRTDFYSSPPDEQIRRLTDLGRTALSEWGLEGAELSMVAYRENMTFKVEAKQRGTVALRVHQGGYRTDAEIQSELDLMKYLNEEGIPTARVVPTTNGALCATISAPGVAEPRQCDVFEWIDGRPLRMTGEPVPSDVSGLKEAYRAVGALAARIYNATERWQRPPGFTRPAWDAEGIFGVNGVIGDFRKLQGATDAQMQMMLDVAERLSGMLDAFGKTPDRWGLSHGDFLPENIIVSAEGIRLVDFDDSGESWYMLDVATAMFDLIDTPAFEPCLGAFVAGYREHRDLPEEHLGMLPAFFLGRLLSYLGWCAKKSHMPQVAVIQPLLMAAFEQAAIPFLAR